MGSMTKKATKKKPGNKHRFLADEEVPKTRERASKRLRLSSGVVIQAECSHGEIPSFLSKKFQRLIMEHWTRRCRQHDSCCGMTIKEDLGGNNLIRLELTINVWAGADGSIVTMGFEG